MCPVTTFCCNTDEQEFDERYIFQRLFLVVVFVPALGHFEIYTLQSVIESRLIGLSKHRKQNTSRDFKGNHSSN